MPAPDVTIDTTHTPRGWRAVVDVGKSSQYLTGYHDTEEGAVREAERWHEAWKRGREEMLEAVEEKYAIEED